MSPCGTTFLSSSATSAAPLLRVRDLRVRFHGAAGSFTAVEDISFDLAAGERVSLVGESGSGKSATCLAVAGYLPETLVEVTARERTFDGGTVTARRGRLPTRLPGVSMIFQDAMTSLDPVWTVGSQFHAVLRDSRWARRSATAEQAKQWLRRVGLTDVDRVLGARPYEMSGGMRQRVMVALALSTRPRLVIADEPTSALDAMLSRGAMELLVELTEEAGAALLLVSHDIHLCREFTDRMMVMYAGRVVEQLASADADTACHPYTRGLIGSVPDLDSSELDELPTIPGALRPRGPGCAFSARCEFATQRCDEQPPVTRASPQHDFRCWHPVTVPAQLATDSSGASR